MKTEKIWGQDVLLFKAKGDDHFTWDYRQARQEADRVFSASVCMLLDTLEMA